MKWTIVIGLLLLCGSVNAQSVVCERFAALPSEPQQTVDRRCPAGYREVGQVGGSSRSGGLSSTQQPLVDAITRSNQRSVNSIRNVINRSKQISYSAFPLLLMTRKSYFFETNSNTLESY